MRREEMQVCEKVHGSRVDLLVVLCVGSLEGLKVGSLKRRVRSQLASDAKLHVVVARSTFGSKKCQNTPVSQQLWNSRRRKSARRGGAKHN